MKRFNKVEARQIVEVVFNQYKNEDIQVIDSEIRKSLVSTFGDKASVKDFMSFVGSIVLGLYYDNFLAEVEKSKSEEEMAELKKALSIVRKNLVD